MADRCVLKRRSHLKKKLSQIKEEGDAVVNFVFDICRQALDIGRTLEEETNNVIFLQNYPIVNKKLDKFHNKILQLNCDVELVASDSEETEQVGQESEIHLQFPWQIQVGDILDMCYLHGNGPNNFWLRNYNTKDIEHVNEIMLIQYQSKQLKQFSAVSCVGALVCAFDGRKCFRAQISRICSDQPVTFVVLDVDTGRWQEINKENIYFLHDDAKVLPAQALNCRLQGNVIEPSLWNEEASALFRRVLAESTLVVTIRERNFRAPPLFTVEVDCHNEERNSSKIELEEWLKFSVFPKLKEMEKGAHCGDYLRPLHKLLEPVKSDTVELIEKKEIRNLAKHKHSDIKLESTKEQIEMGQGDQKRSSRLSQQEQRCKHHSPGNVDESSKKKIIASAKPLSNLSLCTPLQEKLENNKKISTEVDTKRNSSLTHTPLSFKLGDNLGKKSALSPENNICLKQKRLLCSVGQKYSALIAHIEDPGEFYIHIVCSANAKIEELQNQMNEYYSCITVSFKSKEEAKRYIGSYCAAFYEEDKKWYRGQIIDWNEHSDDDSVHIKFVDYGNHSFVNFNMLQPLREQFSKSPIFSTKCHLAKIHPPNSKPDNISKIWSEESRNVFKYIVCTETVYSVVVTESDDDRMNSLPVLMMYTQDGKPIILNAIFVQDGYAVSFSSVDEVNFIEQKNKGTGTVVQRKVDCDNQSKCVNSENKVTRTEKSRKAIDNPNSSKRNDVIKQASSPEDDDEMDHWDPMTEDFYSVTNTQYHDNEDACYAVTGYKPQDERRICKFFSEKGYCFKGGNCTKEHILPNPDGWTTDQELVFTEAYSKIILPDIGDEIQLDITYICNVNHFYAVLHHHPQKKKHAEEEDMDEEETLLTLNNYINQDENVRALTRLHILPALGQIVIARFNKDGRYYRARVIDYLEDKVNVYFVDFGNKEFVSNEDIYNIDPKYLHLPFQAIDCALVNVDIDTSDTDEGVWFFKSLAYREGNYTFYAKVLARLDHVSRLEVLLRDENGIDVGETIISKGFGKKRVYRVTNTGCARILVG